MKTNTNKDKTRGLLVVFLRAFLPICVFGMLFLVGQAHAALAITSVTLNGEAAVTVLPGATITVVVSVTTSGVTAWSSTRFTTNPATTTACVDHSNYTTNGNYNETFTITAPAATGTYNAIFRASSNNSCGGTNSPTLTLTGGIVVATAPTVTTNAATAITATGATLNGTASSNGASSTVTFDYGLTAAYGSTATAAQSPLAAGGASGTAVSAAVSGLTCNTTYHFRVNGENSMGTTNGGDLAFTTSACPLPTVTTNAATLVTFTGATFNGTVSSNGSNTTVTFEYGLTAAYGSTATATQSPLAAGASGAAVSAAVTGLSPNTLYHFRAKGVNSGGTTNGLDQTFTTLPLPTAIYTLDDETWNDSSGNNYHGAVGGSGGTAPIFSSASPAVGTTVGTCGYRTFNRPDKTYIYLPTTFPNLGASGAPFTITAWIRTTDNTQSGQRILIDDEGVISGAAGYGFSLGDGGTGTVRFFTRGTTSALILDTPNVVANNTWYFVAAVADVPNKRKYIYVFNAAGTLLSTVNATWTEGSFGSDGGVVSIGGETNASGENTGQFGFAGNIDEVRVYPKALSQTDLSMVQSITRTCPPDVVTPGRFNACEVTSPKCVPTTLPAVAYAALADKYVGQSFSLDGVALLTGGTLSTFAGSVQVDLVANTNTGVSLDSNNCPVSQTATIALGNKSFVAGRVALTGITVLAAYGDVRVKYTCSAAVCGTAVTSCSTDNFAVVSPGPHHLELQHGTGSGLTCAASTLTVKACADGLNPCTAYTGGVSGTLAATGTPTANWNGGAGFNIPVGSSSVTKDLQLSAAGTVVLGTTSLTPSASNATTCNFGSPSCTFTVNTAGFIFSNTSTGNTYAIPAQVAGTTTAPNALYLRAVQASTTNAAVCTPAIIGQTVSVNMGYACNDPATCSTGNLAFINANAIAGSPNSNPQQNSTAVSLAFNANGSAPITVRYDDVGKITLYANKTVTPFGGATAVTLNGNSNAFVVAPASFAIGGLPGVFTAGSNFSAAVTARNSAGVATPNFGKEGTAESVTMTATQCQPSGTGVFAGSFGGGTVGGFSTGAASVSGMTWSEVGNVDLVATLKSGSYLSSGLSARGNTGTSGTVCNTGVGNVGRFIPDHFTTTVTQGCAAGGFTYSGQPFTLKVEAWNGALPPALTRNYDGSSANMAPYFSKAVTLSARNSANTADNPGPGALTPAQPPVLVLASAFAAGAATVTTPVYTFSSRETVPTVVRMRATDTDSVSSSSFAEGLASIRSGRLQISNAYGSELLALPVPLVAAYWNGSSFVRNVDDVCTMLPVPTSGSGLTLHLTGGASTTATLNTPLVAGNAGFRLSAPVPNNTGYVDIVISAPDYLKAAGGTNPTARATFGMRKTPLIYRRENY